ncbi:putative MFS family arabinose efflux permease [Prosthecobacter fusiformis]|uniref:Putative MFS family arabinose efflux permease n=1 Tax=Prosthecobacter fusiformis TaxID=48464 RepID=A0A4R7S0C9_9BACT|nr:MFS transporter [Prosthecobacter fusiformis]TDU70605.1 putative MFS family arabinose efflux permease [Prosthecobacter fusiformis]
MSASAPQHPHSHAVRRNFICHCLEGGLYMGGTAFLAPESVLPKMVETLGGQAWIIAMMPVLLPAASASAGVFIAPIVERLPRFKPWVLFFGFLQRLPYLITGLILMYADNIEGALLSIVVLTPIISGLLGGITVVAWMEMVTRMVPEKARAAGWAVRYIIQAVIGILAGAVIHQVLTHFDNRTAYAWLHLAVFGLLFVSWLSQLFMHEDEHMRNRHPATPCGPYRDYLHSLPGILRAQPRLIKLVITRFTGMGYLMVVSFLTIHALNVTGRPKEDMGRFVTCQAVGVVLGSLLASWVGYRSGGKVLLQASRVVCVALCIWVSVTESFTGFMLSYFVLGFGLFLDRVGDLTLAAELCPPERRSTLQAILGFCNVFAFLLATFISGQIYAWTQSFETVATVAAAFAIISMIILHRIPEPRLVAVQKNS